MADTPVDGLQPPPTVEEEVEARTPYNEWVKDTSPSEDEGQDHTKEE